MTRKKLPGIQAGIAGEYFVAAELSRRGYVACLTLRNTRGIDILASNPEATKSVGIQVKTTQSSRPIWMLNKKAEIDLAENLFYVLVCLLRTGVPAYHVVPRKIVAKCVTDSHRKWLATPGRGGRQHRDTDVRQFSDLENRYKDRWELLGLD